MAVTPGCLCLGQRKRERQGYKGGGTEKRKRGNILANKTSNQPGQSGSLYRQLVTMEVTTQSPSR